jgi:hypothetical protein
MNGWRGWKRQRPETRDQKPVKLIRQRSEVRGQRSVKLISTMLKLTSDL